MLNEYLILDYIQLVPSLNLAYFNKKNGMGVSILWKFSQEAV